MLVDTDKLVKQSTYARMIGKKRQYVGELISKGKLQTIQIDGTPYVILSSKQPPYIILKDDSKKT